MVELGEHGVATLHGHIGNVYLNSVAMATGVKKSIKSTMQLIQCIVVFMRCKYHIYTAELKTG